MEDYVNMWQKAGGYPNLYGMDAVSKFAIQTCFSLDGCSREIDRRCPEGAVLGLLKWYRDIRDGKHLAK